MIYLFESKIPDNKSVFIALTYIYGINTNKAKFICKMLGISLNFKVHSLSKEQQTQLETILEKFNNETSSNLKKFNSLNAKKLVSIKSYRGLRRHMGLPVRGQRTHTNAKTSRKKI